MSDFKPKMHQIVCRLRLCPRPCWESLQHFPRPLSWILGGLLPREERGGERKGRGEGRGKEKGKGKERERPARGKCSACSHFTS